MMQKIKPYSLPHAIYCYICLQSSWSLENGILVSINLYFSPRYEPFSSIALLDNCGAIFTYAYHNLQKTVDLKGAQHFRGRIFSKVICPFVGWLLQICYTDKKRLVRENMNLWISQRSHQLALAATWSIDSSHQKYVRFITSREIEL